MYVENDWCGRQKIRTKLIYGIQRLLIITNHGKCVFKKAHNKIVGNGAMNMYKKEIKGKYNFVKNKKYIKYIIYIIYIHMEKKKKKKYQVMINRIKDTNIANLQTYHYFTNFNFQLKM